MENHIEILSGTKDEKRAEEEAFLLLSDDEKFRIASELSEIMLHIQWENGVLPNDKNFTLCK